MILNKTTDKIQVVLASAITTNELQCYSEWENLISATVPQDRRLVLTNSTTDVDLVTFEAGTIKRTVKSLSIYNSDTVSATVIIKFDDNGTEKILYKKTILPGESIYWNQSEGFFLNKPQSNLWQFLSRDGRGFTAVTGFVTIAGTTETDFVLIRNPAASGVLVRLKEMLMTIGATNIQYSRFRFYRAPTITSVGTPVTVNKVLSSSANTSPVLVYQSPTISARGTLIQMFSVTFETLTREQDLARYLVEGADLLITVQGSNNNLEHNLAAVWADDYK